ncbi:MAG TPA: hypothetical protein VF199_05275 [Bacillales bacterium]
MDSLRTSVELLMKETFEGPAAEGSWYTTTNSKAGIFGTLEGLSAAEASVSVEGTTIAAHADHTRYYVWVINALLKGEEPKKDWETSWQITSVDEKKWGKIRKELQGEYEEFRRVLETCEWKNESLTNVLGTMAHSAYHLGAIRQMVKVVKEI